MNRQQRRAEARRARREKLDPAVAYHEAGHAVGRYLTAEECGVSVEKCITGIKVAPDEDPVPSQDGTGELVPLAATGGPMLPDAITEIMLREHPDGGPMQIADTIAKLRDSGRDMSDVDKWLRGRAVITMFGGIAEAAATGRNPRDVLRSYGCETDIRQFFGLCQIAGRTDPKEMADLRNEGAERAAELMQRPDVCAAIKAVAGCLPAFGRVDGKKIIAIIQEAMAGHHNNPGNDASAALLLHLPAKIAA
jgi:hypothetical protein